jgi:fimbrial isopeptide formation D2 family protein/LPXTG-motif cell wall-anchored protein
MKLIKKIAAIMLSVMMVLGMASVVSADGTTTSGTYGDNNGTITISNAIENQTYKIYRILKLESFSKTGTTGNYAYTVEDGWTDFVADSATDGKYLTKDSSGYVTWKTGVKEDDAANLAKEALEYAKKTTTITPATNAIKASDTSVTFSTLPLGYYLVDSSAGALCGLTTTNPTATIREKNGVPSVDKKVQEDSKVNTADEWGESNTADIGQTVNFQTTITAQPGAQNYVLHDKMDVGLTFTDGSVIVKKGTDIVTNNPTVNYEVKTATDGCTFHVEFTQMFCDTLKAGDQIIVTYSATLNENAVIAGEENKNNTWLKYGESSETTHDTTTTKTFELPVFKYTGTDTPLENAKFELKREGETAAIALIKKTSVTGTTPTYEGDIYRVAKNGETDTVTEVTTPASGKFKIEGLDAGKYSLTETKQPAGYNKLSAPITVVIAENGNITVGEDSTTVTEVKVLNNTGTILPTTGGNGTSLIYFLGAVLALVSGVVLITKQRMKNN